MAGINYPLWYEKISNYLRVAMDMIVSVGARSSPSTRCSYWSVNCERMGAFGKSCLIIYLLMFVWSLLEPQNAENLGSDVASLISLFCSLNSQVEHCCTSPSTVVTLVWCLVVSFTPMVVPSAPMSLR